MLSSKAAPAKKALPPGKPRNWPNSSPEEIAMMKSRNVIVGGEQIFDFVDNSVKTSKYEILTFIPLFLLEEFNPHEKFANLYFLCIAGLQCVKAISNTNGLPTFLIPLSIVVAIDAFFHALEDYHRHIADRIANETPTMVFDRTGGVAGTGTFKKIARSQLQIGDIVRIDNRTEIPADCVILSVCEKTEPAQGLCFVETKQLDGETNLKSRSALPNTFTSINTPDALNALQGFIEMEHPNSLIDSFNGVIKLKRNEFFPDSGPGAYEARKSIQPSNVLLRGCVLRNTEYVYALVVNTGHDTKIMMNSRGAKAKSSALAISSSKEVVKIITLLLTICLVGTIGQAIWNSDNDINGIWYLGADVDPTSNFFVAYGYFFLLHASCIPVSLYVSMTIIRGGQTWFMNKDLDMYYEKIDCPANVRCMTLNEELGQISHIFSDKTGTLTCNIMNFRKMSVGGISYGLGITEIGKASWKLKGKEIPVDVLQGEAEAQKRSVPHVSFYCPDYDKLMESRGAKHDEMQLFFRLLAMCHDVIPEHSDGVIKLSASNPDDEALVAAAEYFGWQFKDREDGKIVLHSREDGELKIELLETIKFTSKRKRMSVVIRETDGSIRLLIKGADTAIVPRVKEGQDALLKTTVGHMEQYSEEGLRCLLVGYRNIPEAEWKQWRQKYLAATTSLEELDKLKKGLPNKIEDYEHEIEQDITLIGSTAIEDKLQNGVPECIAELAAAGMNIWVLTGDKEETAINIAVACNLVLPEKYMTHIIINEKNASNPVQLVKILEAEIDKIKKELKNSSVSDPLPRALIIDGPSLIIALDPKSNYAAKQLLLELSKSCQAVVGCRVSPDQKREMVDLIKSGVPDVRTLAIGDGANDVAMIQEAHIGVGIKGEEGLQAVNSSDYAIAQFRFLSHLMLKHGRYNYIRMSNLICYVFFKNVMGSISMFWFNIYNGWSGQKLYTEYAIQMFNLLFTSLPILFYGIYDRDVPVEFVHKYPRIYGEGKKNKYFNSRVFFGWIFTAIWQSVILCILPFLFLVNGGGDDGMSESFWGVGAMSYTAVIIVVNFKLFSFQHEWHWVNYGVIAFSIALWWGFAIFISYDMTLSFTTWYNVFMESMQDANFWAGIVWLTVVFTLYETIYHGFWRCFYPTNEHIMQESRLFVHEEDPDKPTQPLLGNGGEMEMTTL